METLTHNLASLFKQLGLENTTEAIETFVKSNRPLPGGIALHEAGFWNVSQASFLKEALSEDSDWAEIVDELNVLLRSPHE